MAFGEVRVGLGFCRRRDMIRVSAFGGRLRTAPVALPALWPGAIRRRYQNRWRAGTVGERCATREELHRNYHQRP